MPAPRVVVVFASRHGGTERLAMNAAVGAVEMRGEIRLRRLPDSSAELRPDAAWLAKEYVAPRDADAAWADAIIFLAPSWLSPQSPDLHRWFASLAAVRASGRWRLRTAAVVSRSPARTAIEQRFTALGLALIDPPAAALPLEAARLLGQAVARNTTSP